MKILGIRKSFRLGGTLPNEAGDGKKGGEESGTFLHRHGQGGLFGDDFAEVDALPVLVLEDADRDFGIMVRVEGHDSYRGGEALRFGESLGDGFAVGLSGTLEGVDDLAVLHQPSAEFTLGSLLGKFFFHASVKALA